MATSWQTNRLKPSMGMQDAIHESGPLANHRLFADPKTNTEIPNVLETHVERKKPDVFASGINTIRIKLELLGLLFGDQFQIGIIPQVFVAVRHEQHTFRVQCLHRTLIVGDEHNGTLILGDSLENLIA